MSSSIVPLLTFKAGRCDGEASSGANSTKLKCLPTPGYIYVYIGLEDELVHFCWRPRSQAASDPEMDLLMFPGDASFTPYTGSEASESSDNVTSPTSGRIFVLKFSSSSQRHLFWLQSKSQHPEGKPNWFSPRDLKLGQIIDMMLQGADIDVTQELSEIEPPSQNNHPDEDHDMGDSEGGNGPRGPRLRANSTGGAGAGATGGDIRDEGEGPREGGADGGRAASNTSPTDASTLVQNLLNSLGGNQRKPGRTSRTNRQEKLFCSLTDLLTPETCTPVFVAASSRQLDALLAQLPPAILLLATRPDDLSGTPVTSEAATEALAQLSDEQKRAILLRVVRSPQMQQSLGSLTVAIRDGGLPSVAEALGVRVADGGFVRGGRVPLGGGEAVEAFVDGVKRTVEEEGEGEAEGMDTS